MGKNLVHIIILFLISLVPLGLVLGCSDSGGCKLDFTECYNSKDFKYDEDGQKLNASSCTVKGCNGCFGCDACSSCIWSKEIGFISIDGKEASGNEINLNGCVNYYASDQGFGCTKQEHQALIYFSDNKNTFIGCESTSCPNCSIGCLNGCFYCGENDGTSEEIINNSIRNLPED